MSDFTSILIIFLIILAAAAFSVFYIKRQTKKSKLNKEDNLILSMLKHDLKEIRDEIKDTREKNISSLENQLKESHKIVKDVTSQLERIHSDHQNVKDLRGQLDKLTDVLANPKQRGILGEYFLETLLKNIFQPHQYKCQYQFKDGETVDAVIFVKDKIIPIDAKFSLENYNRVLEERNPEQKEALEKKFKQDLKSRIEETAKYIRPQEKTMEFAFMFIPSEGIYYDLLVNQIGGIKSKTYDLIEYAFKEKRVIVVSPTSFYAYLQTVLQGLKALQIEESAKQIRGIVEGLQKHFLGLNVFMKKLGNNLSTTVNTYEKTYKELAKIDKDVVKITDGKKKIEAKQIDKPNI